jgi:hypothetical protein
MVSEIERNLAKLMSVPESVPEITAFISLFRSLRNESTGSKYLSEQAVTRHEPQGAQPRASVAE